MGQHNVMNAMAAMAVCAECGMTMEEAARGLLTGQGFKNRQQVHETGRFTILDDSYNACPESMKRPSRSLRSFTRKGAMWRSWQRCGSWAAKQKAPTDRWGSLRQRPGSICW